FFSIFIFNLSLSLSLSFEASAQKWRSHSHNTVDALSHTRRAYHIELGAREKALLAEDPALKCFKSHKKSVNAVKRMGDVLTLVVVAVMKPMVSLKHFIGFLPSLSRILVSTFKFWVSLHLKHILL
ncbi:succinate dehydrogenase subunit 7A, mitochondrial-like, partial [Quercus robur]|uniref:succinate dehydrogenase subunit 7A, mitochondrial-like n=1 Tax=Quercus robur TaxID=38942 RepID=UPI002162C32D